MAVEPISGCALLTTLTSSANCRLEDTAIKAAEDRRSFSGFFDRQYMYVLCV